MWLPRCQLVICFWAQKASRNTAWPISVKIHDESEYDNLHSLLEGIQAFLTFEIFPPCARASFKTIKGSLNFNHRMWKHVILRQHYTDNMDAIRIRFRPGSSKQCVVRLEEVGVLQAWQYLSYFMVQILKGREWDVTIQNNEPPGSTFPGSHTVMSLDLLGALQLIIEASPPPQTINATALQPSPSHLNEVVK